MSPSKLRSVADEPYRSPPGRTIYLAEPVEIGGRIPGIAREMSTNQREVANPCTVVAAPVRVTRRGQSPVSFPNPRRDCSS